MKRTATHLRATVPALAAAALVAAAGCTICPDPFDYTGPVPDGAASQNDFRARANGILPLGSQPMPWPPVVRAAPGAADESHEVTVAAEAAAGDEPAADVPAAPDAPTGAPIVEVADEPPAGVIPAATAPPEADEPRPTATDEPMLEEILPRPAPSWPQVEPPLRETPGWRPRG